MFCTRFLVQVSACVLAMMFFFVQGDHYSLEYTCLTSNVITVKNPDVGILKSATAGTVEHICIVTTSAETSTFTITGCHMNEDIIFTLSTRQGVNATGDGIIGGTYSETYVLHCTEIADDGIIFNTSINLDVGLTVDHPNGTNSSTHAPQYTEDPVTPSFTIVSSIWNSDETQTVSNANVGELLKWKVQGPYEYDLLPFLCTVNPGSVYGDPPLVTVIQNGCSAVDMVKTFEPSNGNPAEKYRVVSDLYAFKFTMSDELTFACSVKICTRGNETCIANCGGRKRRAPLDMPHDMNGLHANVVSHLTIGLSAAVKQGLSSILLVATCIIGLGQNLLYLKI